MFKTWWQPANMHKHLKALAKTRNPKKLRKWAIRSGNEQIQLAAAQQLQDREWLTRLAHKARLNSVRIEAARLIDDQPSLAAIALKEWGIERGCTAVRHISNELLLQRIARTARQDAVRLAAALRLKNRGLLRQLAHSVADVQVRWKIARVLDDPYQMADIAMFKPTSEYMDTLRRKARQSLLKYLNRQELNQRHRVLLSFMHSVPYPLFKLEAFMRLPLREVSPDQLHYLAGLDLRYMPPLLLKLVFVRIKACGWHVVQRRVALDCTGCQGEGELMLDCVVNDPIPLMGDIFPCPECHGTGRVPVTALTCSHETCKDVVFHLPADSFHLQRSAYAQV